MMSSLRPLKKILRISSARQASLFVRAILLLCHAMTFDGATASAEVGDSSWSIDISVEEIVGGSITGVRVLTLGIDPSATEGIDPSMEPLEIPFGAKLCALQNSTTYCSFAFFVFQTCRKCFAVWLSHLTLPQKFERMCS